MDSENKKWSKKFDKCTGCGSALQSHWARGYCTICYPKYIVRKTGSFDRKNPVFYDEFMKDVKSKISAKNKIMRNAPTKISDILNRDLLEEL